ncbi:hypothetical protein LCGC14_2994550 [marine sediment metagenome]|uniref:Uncharacterized protein n=1 Tax=marine sediment metagenome TaxID=412755 RepID=A0A0F8X2W1_9ZZZZ
MRSLLLWLHNWLGNVLGNSADDHLDRCECWWAGHEEAKDTVADWFVSEKDVP